MSAPCSVIACQLNVSGGCRRYGGSPFQQLIRFHFAARNVDLPSSAAPVRGTKSTVLLNTAPCPEKYTNDCALTTPIRNLLVHHFCSRPSIYEPRAFSSRKPRYTRHAFLPHSPFRASESCYFISFSQCLPCSASRCERQLYSAVGSDHIFTIPSRCRAFRGVLDGCIDGPGCSSIFRCWPMVCSSHLACISSLKFLQA